MLKCTNSRDIRPLRGRISLELLHFRSKGTKAPGPGVVPVDHGPVLGNPFPSPPWGRGWRATGVVISRGEKGAPRSACRGGEGVDSRGRGGNHEGRASLSLHAFSCSERRANPESARTSPHANGRRTSCSADLFCRSAVLPPYQGKAADLQDRSALPRFDVALITSLSSLLSYGGIKPPRRARRRRPFCSTLGWSSTEVSVCALRTVRRAGRMPAVPARTMPALQASPALLVGVDGLSAARREWFARLYAAARHGDATLGASACPSFSPRWAGILSDLNAYTSGPRLRLTKVIINMYTHLVDNSR